MPLSRIPLIVYGDGPRLPSGLGRIARDLLLRLLPEEETLGVTVHQLGVDPPDGWHHQAWPLWGFQPDAPDQGREALDLMVRELSEAYEATPIVLMVMDPSRCFDLTRNRGAQAVEDGQPPITFWGYFPIDSENIQGRIGGPAAETILACDRLLGYGHYGATILHATLEAAAAARLARPGRRPGPLGPISVPGVPHLPHGLDPSFHPGVGLEQTGPMFSKWRLDLPGDAWILGCVATNQARKDLSLLFASASVLKRRGAKVGIWLHTDRLTNAWDVGQLSMDFGFDRREVCVSTATTLLSDEQLAARYDASDVTLGVGLGEGFGYPLVESLACGTPVVHGKFAGGVDLIPRLDWLVEPAAWRLESCYAVKRPVLKPDDVAGALALAIQWKRQERALCVAYCSGAVSYLQWNQLWPRWRSWIRRGLEEARDDGQRSTAQPPHAPRSRADDALRPAGTATPRGGPRADVGVRPDDLGGATRRAEPGADRTAGDGGPRAHRRVPGPTPGWTDADPGDPVPGGAGTSAGTGRGDGGER